MGGGVIGSTGDRRFYSDITEPAQDVIARRIQSSDQAERDLSEIETAIANIHNSLAYVEARADTLVTRLDRVMQPESTACDSSGDKEKSVSRSPLGEQLHVIDRSIVLVGKRLENILARLAL